MPRRLALAVAIVALFVAVNLAGAVRDMRQTPTVIDRHSTAWEVVELPVIMPVVVTATPRPYVAPTPTMEVEYRWPTPTPYGPTRGIVQVQ